MDDNDVMDNDVMVNDVMDNDVMDNDVMDDEWQQKQVKPESKPYTNAISFVSSCLCVVDTPIRCIDEYYCSNNGIVYHWSDLQKVCIGILVDLLETVLACNGQIECHTKEKVCNGRIEEEKMAEQIMEYVKLCHCNGLKLLEWKQVTRRRRLNNNDDDDDGCEDYDYGDDFVLSMEGVAILSCMLLKETCSYLPVVLSHQYRLHLGLVHISHILEVYSLSNHKLVMMALVCILEYFIVLVTLTAGNWSYRIGRDSYFMNFKVMDAISETCSLIMANWIELQIDSENLNILKIVKYESLEKYVLYGNHLCAC